MYSDEQIRQIILDCISPSDLSIDAQVKIRTVTDERFLQTALSMLDEENDDAVHAAIVALRNLSNFNPSQFLQRVCQFLEIPSQCASAIWYIWTFGDASYVPRLIPFLSHHDKNARYEALRALSRFGYHDLLEVALYMLNDSDAHVRSAACSIIAKYQDIRVVPALISKLSDLGDDEYSSPASVAASKLGEIGDLRAVQPLMNAVRHGDEHLAWRAILALRDIKINSLESFCLEQIWNKHHQVRMEIMYILRDNPKAEFTDPLISIVQTDPDLNIQGWAASILKNIGTAKALAVADKWIEEHKRKS